MTSTRRSGALARAFAKGSSGTKVSEFAVISFDVLPKADTMTALRRDHCELQMFGGATRNAITHQATVHKATVHKVIDF